MDAIGVVDGFYASCESKLKTIEGALCSRSNMGQQVKEDARNALSELRSLIYSNFDKFKTESSRIAYGNVLTKIYEKKSYASVVAPSMEPLHKEKNDIKSCDIVVCANEQGTLKAEDIETIIKTQIDPRSNKIDINKLRVLPNDKVLVECVSDEDRKTFHNILTDNCSALSSTLTKRKFPNIIIKNVPYSLQSEELINVLFEQNAEILLSEEDL